MCSDDRLACERRNPFAMKHFSMIRGFQQADVFGLL
jgi:hypothetical protein